MTSIYDDRLPFCIFFLTGKTVHMTTPPEKSLDLGVFRNHNARIQAQVSKKSKMADPGQKRKASNTIFLYFKKAKRDIGKNA